MSSEWTDVSRSFESFASGRVGLGVHHHDRFSFHLAWLEVDSAETASGEAAALTGDFHLAAQLFDGGRLIEDDWKPSKLKMFVATIRVGKVPEHRRTSVPSHRLELSVHLNARADQLHARDSLNSLLEEHILSSLHWPSPPPLSSLCLTSPPTFLARALDLGRP